jgi:hypothetical protein
VIYDVFLNTDDYKLYSMDSQWWFGYVRNFNVDNMDNCNDIKVEWFNTYKIFATSPCIYEQISTTYNSKKNTFNNKCIKNKHILQFHGLNNLQHRIDNYDLWLLENEKSKIITKNIKRCNIRHKFKMMFKVYKVIKRFIIYKKWKKTIKHYTVYMFKYRAATIINNFIHGRYVRSKCIDVVHKNTIHVTLTRSTNTINRFMHTSYIHLKWKRIIKSAKYYKMAHDEWNIKLNQQLKEHDAIFKRILKSIILLPTVQQVIANKNYLAYIFQVRLYVDAKNKSYEKLIKYNIKSNHSELFLDTLTIRNMNTKYWRQIIKVNEQLHELQDSLQSKIITDEVLNARVKTTRVATTRVVTTPISRSNRRDRFNKRIQSPKQLTQSKITRHICTIM